MKRKTKQQKISQEKAALKQRLADMARGAYGGNQPLDFDADTFGVMSGEMGLDAFGRWLVAIGKYLLGEKHQYLIELWNLAHFDSLDGAVDFLHEHGVRA